MRVNHSQYLKGFSDTSRAVPVNVHSCFASYSEKRVLMCT